MAIQNVHEGRPAAPAVIDGYFKAHDRRDTEAALRAFAEDARVQDDGHDYLGLGAISRWLSEASVEYTYTRTMIEAQETAPESWSVINHLEGNFPGGQVDLRYAFTLTGDHIAELVIAPR